MGHQGLGSIGCDGPDDAEAALSHGSDRRRKDVGDDARGLTDRSVQPAEAAQCHNLHSRGSR